MKRLLTALLLALALALAPSGADAKVSYGPCVDYMLWQWRESGGAGGVGPLMLKIYTHCDADGDWRAW